MRDVKIVHLTQDGKLLCGLNHREDRYHIPASLVLGGLRAVKESDTKFCFACMAALLGFNRQTDGDGNV